MQLYVNDVEKSLLFYKKIIGLKLSIQMGFPQDHI
ncbi:MULTISPECIES: VOC family protein [Bacillus]|nr:MULTISPECIES: VOC family protein [Bacillus cereus group]MDA1908189.1 VOC family protein [Bacillus cereus]MDQ7234575.1 VOC family protein [Bacillus pacificus]MDQ7239410.1 VOC family protein [Bacillus pacificus]